jgi:hypothetical protein
MASGACAYHKELGVLDLALTTIVVLLLALIIRFVVTRPVGGLALRVSEVRVKEESREGNRLYIDSLRRARRTTRSRLTLVLYRKWSGRLS